MPFLFFLLFVRSVAALKKTLTLPRVWIGDGPAAAPEPGATAWALAPGQRRHLRTVLRRRDGDGVRVFGKALGEWAATLEGDRLVADRETRPPVTDSTRLELFFAPLRKKRCSLLLEKATELGATRLAPVRTTRTEAASIAALKAGPHAAVVEAAEQSERLDAPEVEALRPCDDLATDLPLFVCAERAGKAPHLFDAVKAAGGLGAAVLVGPEGGLAEEDLAAIARGRPDAVVCCLGDSVLRAETACWAAVTLARAALR